MNFLLKQSLFFYSEMFIFGYYTDGSLDFLFFLFYILIFVALNFVYNSFLLRFFILSYLNLCRRNSSRFGFLRVMKLYDAFL